MLKINENKISQTRTESQNPAVREAYIHCGGVNTFEITQPFPKTGTQQSQNKLQPMHKCTEKGTCRILRNQPA